MTKPHVWIIGFPRCGTASLCEALRVLGWNPIHNPRHWDQLEGHNAAADVMIIAHWRELFAMFPRSRFILNTRDFVPWTRSLRRIPRFWSSQLLYDRYHRQVVYGTDSVRDTAALRRAWDWHLEVVSAVIPRDQLLVMQQPFTWGPLVDFLDVPIPGVPFPWLNRQSNRHAVVRMEERGT